MRSPRYADGKTRIRRWRLIALVTVLMTAALPASGQETLKKIVVGSRLPVHFLLVTGPENTCGKRVPIGGIRQIDRHSFVVERE